MSHEEQKAYDVIWRVSSVRSATSPCCYRTQRTQCTLHRCTHDAAYASGGGAKTPPRRSICSADLKARPSTRKTPQLTCRRFTTWRRVITTWHMTLPFHPLDQPPVVFAVCSVCCCVTTSMMSPGFISTTAVTLFCESAHATAGHRWHRFRAFPRSECSFRLTSWHGSDRGCDTTCRFQNRMVCRRECSR